jgi:general secretion pathway protein G
MSHNDLRSNKAHGGLPFAKVGWLLCSVLLISLVVASTFMSCPTNCSKFNDAQTQIRDLQIHILSFRSNAGELPSKLQDLVTRPSHLDDPRWRQYAKRDELMDTWGNPIIYRFPGTQNLTGFDLFSVGPDRQEGTEDDIWGD